LVIPEFQGRIGLYDLEGKFIKMMKMEYGVVDCIALKNNKIAVLGFVLYKNGRHRDIVVIKDIQTEKESHVTFFVRDMSADHVSVRKDPYSISFSGPFAKINPYIRRTKAGNLLVGNPRDSKITVYSPEGKTIKSFTLSAKPVKVTEKTKQEFLDGTKESIKRLKLSENILDEMNTKPGFFPEYTPLYYQAILDSEDNLLVFIYTNDKEKHVFQVYSPEGTYICDTVIDPGKFKLRVNSRLKTMVFFKGALYGLFELKEGGDIPIRLIRVRLQH
jgi:hypothetical protein